MWDEIERCFAGYPAQKKVALLLLAMGLRIKGGRVHCGNIEAPHIQIAKELGIDRRVVDSAASRIMKNDKLMRIYSQLEPIAFLRNSAPAMGLNVMVITASDAAKPGIIGGVTSVIAKRGISIRQAIADDPYLSETPELTIITEGEVPGDLINEIRRIPGVEKVTFY
ncbi:MAG: amino acid-binding protein [Candidatus Hydrothermarchaeaceae archaeon]